MDSSSESILFFLLKEKVSVLKFECDLAFVYVVWQVVFGFCVFNIEGYCQIKVWLVEQLECFGVKVIVQDFEVKAYIGEVLQFINIIVQFNFGA